MTHHIRALIAATGSMVLLAVSSATQADLLGGYVSPGDRDPEVAELLERSEWLRSVAEANPALAQMIVQRLLELATEHGVSLLADPDSGGTGDLELEPLRRASPTAVLDLIELMKQASKARQVGQRPRPEE